MLIINTSYTPLHKLIWESVASDSFEKLCYNYLVLKYPNRKFKLLGSNNNTVADILVDDSFYIECKMSDTTLGNGAQATGFGLALVKDSMGNDSFECSKQNFVPSKAMNKIIDYINSNIDSFIAVAEPNSGTVDINLPKSIFSQYISDYYKNKNVEFFMTSIDGEFSIFRNTPGKISQYFDISACVRFFGYGTKSLPKGRRDEVLKFLNSQYKVKSVRYDGSKMYVTLKKPIQNRYINYSDLSLFMSSAGCNEGEYRIMKLTGRGAPRVMFKLRTIKSQSPADLKSFEKF